MQSASESLLSSGNGRYQSEWYIMIWAHFMVLPIALLWGYFMAFRRECYDRKSNQSTIDKGYHSGIFGDSFIVWLCWYSYSFSRLCYCCSFSKLIGMINVHYLCAKNKHCKKYCFWFSNTQINRIMAQYIWFHILFCPNSNQPSIV